MGYNSSKKGHLKAKRQKLARAKVRKRVEGQKASKKKG